MSTETVRDVLIAAIDVVSNPRKRFDEEKLQSLAASIERDGLVQPVLVRPSENGGRQYELVAGERRLRAHTLLGRDMVRATIREMDAHQAARIRLVENLHREDLHELDEAQAFQELLDDQEYTVEMLADECGRSPSYVYQRLKLLDLIEAARDAFAGGEISAAHAILIARLNPVHQEQCMKQMQMGFREDYSASDLRRFIEREVLLQLKRAPFSPKDEDLLPAAGSCVACPKRTGNAPGLWPDIDSEDTCTDRDCYKQKVGAFVAAEVEKGTIPVRHSYGEKSKAYPKAVELTYRTHESDHRQCESSERAVRIDEARAGQVLFICRGPCETHFANRKKSPADKRMAKQQKERSRRSKEVQAILRAKIDERVDLGLEDLSQLRCLVHRALDRLYHENQVELARELGFEGKQRQYGGGRDYSADFTAWVDGQDRDALVRSLVRLLTTSADFNWSGDWDRAGESGIGRIATDFGYGPHNAVRSVRAAAEVKLPEDSK